MTKSEHKRITEILALKPWEVTRELRKYMESVKIEETSPTRTGTQNNSLHLWFDKVSDECIKNHVDAKLVMTKVMRMDMTPEFIKTMWKTLQRALFKKKSTTQLKKTGEIDIVRDHFIRFFAEEFKMELPPFPNDKQKAIEQNQGYKTGGKLAVDYPDNYEEPTI